MGCRVFLVWEDIVEVKPKMILTLLASVCAEDMKRRQLDKAAVSALVATAVLPGDIGIDGGWR